VPYFDQRAVLPALSFLALEGGALQKPTLPSGFF
jgi:hypothetical protein